MRKYYLILFIPFILLSACSDKQDKSDESHLLEGHKKAIDKAKDLDKVIQEGLKKRQEESLVD